MIIDTTTKSIELVLAGTVTINELPVFVSFIRGTLPQSLVRQSQASISNGTTDVTILSAPSAKESKTVTFVSVFNADTVDATVTIKFDDAATEKVIVTITLVTGDTLIFTEEEGFKVIDKDGGIKGSATASFATPIGDVDIGDSAAEGSNGAHSRADHQHAHPAPGAGYPLDIAASEVDGSATTPARSDHVHAHGSGYAHNVTQLINTEDTALQGDISPSSLGANQNDFNPTGLATATVIRLTASTPINITGLQGGADGRLIIIYNIGATNTITLTDSDGASSAANQFDLVANIGIVASGCVMLQYDSTSSRWRCIGRNIT